jgi:hypothetical protein
LKLADNDQQAQALSDFQTLISGRMLAQQMTAKFSGENCLEPLLAGGWGLLGVVFGFDNCIFRKCNSSYVELAETD